jgi:hypothetical protein
MPDVATSLDALTPAWLTATLSARFPGIAVGAARVAPLDTGHNYVGNLARVELAGVTGAADAPPAIVAKLVPEAAAARALGVGMGIYLREALFYDSLAGSVASRPPDCYGVSFDVDSGFSALLLEDLTDLEVGVQSAGYTPQRARATVLQLADQHAAFWNAAALADMPWLPIWNQPAMVGFVTHAFAQVWPACQAVFAAWLTQDDVALGDRLGAALPGLMAAIGEPPVTLLHGDARYDNLLFDRGDADAPPRTVDWQFVARGRGTQDIAYFLTQSGDAGVSARHERGLVAAYHDRLVARGVADYPADACWIDYRKFALYGLVYPIFATGLVDPANSAQLEATAAILRRGFDAAARLDSASLVPI